MLGDFNARVGKREEESTYVIGKFGEERLNNNRIRLIDYCILNDLIVTNTFYEHKEIHMYSRQGSDAADKSLIDYILVERKNRKSIIDVRARRGPEIYSDHFLIETKI